MSLKLYKVTVNFTAYYDGYYKTNDADGDAERELSASVMRDCFNAAWVKHQQLQATTVPNTTFETPVSFRVQSGLGQTFSGQGWRMDHPCVNGTTIEAAIRQAAAAQEAEQSE